MMGVGPTHTASGFMALGSYWCGRATDRRAEMVSSRSESGTRCNREGEEERRGERRGGRRGGDKGEEASDGLLIYRVDMSAPRDELVDSRTTDLLRYGRIAVVCHCMPSIARRRQTVLMVLPSALSPALLGGVVFESVLGNSHVSTLAVGGSVLRTK